MINYYIQIIKFALIQLKRMNKKLSDTKFSEKFLEG